MMSNDERITRIRKARTHQDLNRALSGLHEQVIATYPELACNGAFKTALDTHQYFHALGDIKRAARGVRGGGYQDVILLLERAAEKQFSLSDKEVARKSA